MSGTFEVTQVFYPLPGQMATVRTRLRRESVWGIAEAIPAANDRFSRFAGVPKEAKTALTVMVNRETSILYLLEDYDTVCNLTGFNAS